MNTSEQRCKGVRVVRLHGENLDAFACRALEDSLLSTLPGDGPILVDVAEVQFADSAGLGLIRSIARKTDACAFGLACVGPRLAKCLERLPDSRRPPSWPSVAEGVRKLQRRTQPPAKPQGSSDVDAASVSW